MVAIRLCRHHDRVETVTFWQGLVVMAIVTPQALLPWGTPNLDQALLLALMSLAFAAGQWLFTAGLRMGDGAAVAPLWYLRLLLMSTLGWLLYAEILFWATAFGALLVMSSAIFIIRNNAKRKADTVASAGKQP